VKREENETVNQERKEKKKEEKPIKRKSKNFIINFKMSKS